MKRALETDAPPKYKDSPAEFNQHILFPTNIFDLLPSDHDCFMFEALIKKAEATDSEEADSFTCPAGKALLYKVIAEPVFGQIKNTGFRGFRGKEKVAGELSLVCSAHNFKKIAKSISTGSIRLEAAKRLKMFV